MTEYGAIINGQLIIAAKYRDGLKPITHTAIPDADEYHRPVCHYVEREEDILEVWQLLDCDPEYHPEPEAQVEDYQSALNELGVNAHD